MSNTKRRDSNLYLVLSLIIGFIVAFAMLDIAVILMVNKLATVKFLSWLFWLFIYCLIGILLVGFGVMAIVIATFGNKPKGSYYRFVIPIILCFLHVYIALFVSEYMSAFLHNGVIGFVFLCVNIFYAVFAVLNMRWKKCPACAGYHYDKVLIQNISSESTVVSKIGSYTTSKTVRGNVFSGPLFVKNAVQVPYSYNAEITKNVDVYMYECADCGEKSEEFVEKSFREERI